MSTFSPEVVTAVLAHMNDDHLDDSLRIVQAHGLPDATAAEMSGLDEDGGDWTVTIGGETREHRVPWPAGRISERAEIRREVVVLHERACEVLGVEVLGH